MCRGGRRGPDDASPVALNPQPLPPGPDEAKLVDVRLPDLQLEVGAVTEIVEVKATGAQVLNTKAIGIRFAEMCVAFGMTQSALTYPKAKLSYQDFTNR